VLSADHRVEAARQDNARWYAPYELQMAESHLEKAQEEAAEGSYEEAIRYARAAEAFAQKSIDLTRERREVQ
jgi:HEPN domain-containing protein